MAALSREPQAGWPASTTAEGLTTSTSASALPEAAATMLTKQLDAHDTRSLVWTGDVWPGQRATLAFEERELRDAPNDADETPTPTSPWRMRITLDLPSLGRVHATLDMHAASLDLALAATKPETQARLATARGELAASLADARLVLGRFDVGPDPDA